MKWFLKGGTALWSTKNNDSNIFGGANSPSFCTILSRSQTGKKEDLVNASKLSEIHQRHEIDFSQLQCRRHDKEIILGLCNSDWKRSPYGTEVSLLRKWKI